MLDLSGRTAVMGIVNVTPDSFSDGGRYLDPEAAVAHALALAAEGADLVDLGAESTRPGSAPVAPRIQLERLMPVLETLVRETDVIVSVDTASVEVAREVLAAGARVINDVCAATEPGMAELVAEHGAGLVLMHMRGTPATMQHDPRYDDAAREVREALAHRLAAAEQAGVAADHVVVDPGIGFGKTVRHNLELLARIDELEDLGRPIMIGVSRKGFLGVILDGSSDERLEGGLAAAAVTAFLGVRVVRTHDVADTVRALRVADALRAARRAAPNA